MVRFGGAPALDRADEAGPAGAVPTTRTAVLAALLGLQEGGGGYVLVGPGLTAAAPGLGAVAPEREIVALGAPPAAGADEVGGGGRVSWLHGVEPGRLPFFSGRFRGVALADGTPAIVEEAIRLLAPRGRLVIVGPAEEAVRTVMSGPLEVLASEDRAVVAVRA